MFAPEAAQLSRALFPAEDPATLGPGPRAGESSAVLWRIYLGGRTCFRRAPRATARDSGTACGHARRDQSPGCGNSVTDKSTPLSTQEEWPNVLSGAAAARRGLFFLRCPNIQSLCPSLYGYNQVGRH